MKRYPLTTKWEAVRLFNEEGMTRAEITAKLGVRSPNRVKAWLREYHREGERAFTKPIGRPRIPPESEQAELERLRMENALLKKLQSELQKDMLARRDIGRSTTTRKSSK